MMKKLLTLLLYGALVFVLTGVGFGAEDTADYIINTSKLNSLSHGSAYSWEFNLGTLGYNQTTETISKIELTFTDIYNYENYANTLFLSVLDSPGKDLNGDVRDWDNTADLLHNTVDSYYRDSIYESKNFFLDPTPSKEYEDAGAVVQLLKISNLDKKGNNITIKFDGLTNTATSTTTVDGVSDRGASYNLSSNAAANLSNWAQDGIFELGFDPDCHFYASGVSLKIFTTTTTLTGGPSHAPEPETLVLFGLGLLGVSALGRKRFS